MKKLHALALILFLLVGIGNVSAQKELKEGTITMEITELDSDNAQMKQALAMMKGSEITVYFNEKKALTSADMMNGMMKTRTLIEKGSKATTTLMDMMGQKIMAKMSEEEAKKIQEKADSNDVKITFDKSDKKKILDYDCYRADITIKVKEQEVKMSAYVTEDLKMNTDLMQGVEADKFEGKVPMEYTVNVSQQGMAFSMTFAVTKILETVEDDVFTIDTEGYKEMTMEELKKMGGGMGF